MHHFVDDCFDLISEFHGKEIIYIDQDATKDTLRVRIEKKTMCLSDYIFQHIRGVDLIITKV